MKKLFTLLVTLILCISSCFCFTACSGDGDGDGDNTPTELSFTASFDLKNTMLAVSDGSMDIAVIEISSAKYFIHQDYSNLSIISGDDFLFNPSSFVVASKKNTNVDDYINAALYSMQQSGKLASLASQYGLEDLLLTIPEPSVSVTTEPDAGSLFADIKSRNYLFAGYSYQNADAHAPLNFGISQLGHSYGFFPDLLLEVYRLYDFPNQHVNGNTTPCVDNIKYVPWDEKELFLQIPPSTSSSDAGIDVIWGGIENTSENQTAFDLSSPYLKTGHVLVVRTADLSKYSSFSAMANAKFTAVDDSLGETLIKGAIKDAALGN